jgi:hypothetical protein
MAVTYDPGADNRVIARPAMKAAVRAPLALVIAKD